MCKPSWVSSIQQIGASFGENESFERALPPIENDDQMKNSFERGLICGISIHNVFLRKSNCWCEASVVETWTKWVSYLYELVKYDGGNGASHLVLCWQKSSAPMVILTSWCKSLLLGFNIRGGMYIHRALHCSLDIVTWPSHAWEPRKPPHAPAIPLCKSHQE